MLKFQNKGTILYIYVKYIYIQYLNYLDKVTNVILINYSLENY